MQKLNWVVEFLQLATKTYVHKYVDVDLVAGTYVPTGLGNRGWSLGLVT